MDPAQDLTNQFKLKGHLDEIKKELLTRKISDKTPMEELIKRIVSDIVKQMVEKNEELLFKNRATTSAELELQITKDYYSLLDRSNKEISLNRYIKFNMKDPELRRLIRFTVEELLANNDELSSKYK